MSSSGAMPFHHFSTTTASLILPVSRYSVPSCALCEVVLVFFVRV
jgi:hypothetical protein